MANVDLRRGRARPHDCASLAAHLRTTFAESEAVVIGSPVVLGSGLFELAVVSASLGCHLFTDADPADAGRAKVVAALIDRLRRAAREAGWDRVCGWQVGEAARPVPRSSPLASWPSEAMTSANAARAALAGSTSAPRPSISSRRRAMDALGRAFRDPLGAFEVDGGARRRARRGKSDLRSELDALDAWLVARDLAQDQSEASRMSIDGRLVELRGPAGSGKTTVLARHAAREMARLRAGGTESGTAAQPRILVTARSASAAAQLRARVLGAHRRWSVTARLPTWVDTMELPRAADRWRALRAGGRFRGYARILVDEAHELDERTLGWLAASALDRDDPRRGILLCGDESQRLTPGMPRLTPLADANGLEHRIVEFQTAYRTPRQVLEMAFNLLHGSFARGHGAPPRPEELDRMLRSCRATAARDQWLRVRFAMRGIGIDGAPPGAPPRAVRAPDARRAALAAAGDAVKLVDAHGALPSDVVIVALDARSALAVARAAVALGHAGRFTRRAKDPAAPPKDLIRILRVDECRGHDFPAVLLAGIERVAPDAAGRTLLYQAATRAQHLLLAYGVAGVGLCEEVAECTVRAGMR
jgi:RecA/RadA recombinase